MNSQLSPERKKRRILRTFLHDQITQTCKIDRTSVVTTESCCHAQLYTILCTLYRARRAEQKQGFSLVDQWTPLEILKDFSRANSKTRDKRQINQLIP